MLIDRRNIRKILGIVFIADADLNAFIIDHFSEIHGRLSDGMDRVEKVNLFLQHASTREIFRALSVGYPSRLNAAMKQIADGAASITSPNLPDFISDKKSALTAVASVSIDDISKFDLNFALLSVQILSSCEPSKEGIVGLLLACKFPENLIKKLRLFSSPARNWNQIMFLFLRRGLSPLPLLRQAEKRHRNNDAVRQLYLKALAIVDKKKKAQNFLKNSNVGQETRDHTQSDRRFLHTVVTADGILDNSFPLNPYENRDADPTTPESGENDIYCFLMLPHFSRLSGRGIGDYTVVSALCTAVPQMLMYAVERKLDPDYVAMLKAPSKIESFSHKEQIAFSLAEPLSSKCFAASVAIPASLLVGAGRDLEIGYQTISSILLLPLVHMHRKMDFHSFNIVTNHIGDPDKKIKGLLKKLVSASFDEYSVQFPEEIEQTWGIRISDITRFVNWAVNAAYSAKRDYRWTDLLSGKKIRPLIPEEP